MNKLKFHNYIVTPFDLKYYILLLSIIFCSCSYFEKKLDLTEIKHEKGKIIIKYTEPSVVFGPQDVFFYYKRNGDTREEILNSTTLYNDGATMYAGNVVVTLNEKDEIHFTMIAEEQKPEKWVFKYNNGFISLKLAKK